MSKPLTKSLRQSLVTLRDQGRHIAESPLRRQRVHYLHIGKTGGTAIKAALKESNKQNNSRVRFVLHPHGTRLCDVPGDDAYVFSIRDPVTRFYSGFYSRNRKGMPRLQSEWTPGERAAFDTFPHADDLASALFEDGWYGRRAWLAMHAIVHLRDHQSAWFRHAADLFEVRPPLCVIRQESLSEDLANLLQGLDLDSTPALPEDPTGAHRNDYSNTQPLSDRAVANLRTWYAADVELMKYVDAWVARER